MRYFSNSKQNNQYYGSLEENGSGKFNDINEAALTELDKFGISHIWYTGILEHATLSDYYQYGIHADHPDVVKGIAGSPYAVKDYYDVAPDLAVNVTQRMEEFEALIHRTHAHNMKVIIDFIPNHLARQYKSDQLPAGHHDFGVADNTSVSFHPNNNYYYLPGQSFISPEGNLGTDSRSSYTEYPARATGNDVFSPSPTIHDWYETVKLNYGIDYLNHHTKYFDPIPNTWHKMRDILLFWAAKGVDGFRCDMAEMVPVEFWHWVIAEVKEQYPEITFIAEIYNPQQYHNYLSYGGFTYLYDKVGLYDTLRRLVEGHGNAEDITRVWQQESGAFSDRMLRFLENHDEQRIASTFFANDAFKALPALVLSATLHGGPILIYNGQELGVKAAEAEGFQGNDGRSTIFDYWGIQELQAWTNNKQYDGLLLNDEQKSLRHFYKSLHKLLHTHSVFSTGKFYDLQYVNNHGQTEGYNALKVYSYLRYTDKQRVIAVFNFDQEHAASFKLKVPKEVWKQELTIDYKQPYFLKVLFTNPGFEYPDAVSVGVDFTIQLPANAFVIAEIIQ